MTFLHRLASIVRWIIRRGRAERDLNDELEAFVDMAAADRMRDGTAPGAAQRLAAPSWWHGTSQGARANRSSRRLAKRVRAGCPVRAPHASAQSRVNAVALLTLALALEPTSPSLPFSTALSSDHSAIRNPSG